MQSSGFDYHAIAGDPTATNPQPPSPPPPRQQNLQQQTQLDPFDSSNYLLNSMSPLDSNLDHRFLWSRQLLRPPDENVSHQDLTGVIATSSASPPTPPSFRKLPSFSATGPIFGQNNSIGNTNNNNYSSSSHNDGIARRKPRKRSRASRRTPTTVLTTDTANFRAMVQEFTGIPAPPFTGSLPFQRNITTNNSRFDLFGSSSSIPENSSSPSYLLRPFAQRLNTPSSFPPSSSSSATLSDYHNFSNSNTQNLSNPLQNFQPSTNPFPDSPVFTTKLRTLGDWSQGNNDHHQAQTMKIAHSSSSQGNEKVHADAMVPDNVGRYTDSQRPHGEH